MKPDPCLPQGEPPAGPRKPDAEYMGYEIRKLIGCFGEVAYFKPGGKVREAKSVALAMSAIARIEGKTAKGSGAVIEDGSDKTYRIGRDRDQLEASRKIVEAREGRTVAEAVGDALEQHDKEDGE